MTAIDKIKDFVEGQIDALDFEIAVNSDIDIEKILTPYESLPPYVAESNLYLYTIARDFKNIRDMYALQNILSTFLSKNNKPHKISDFYSKLTKLQLKVQPSWLLIPSSYFSNMIKDADEKDENKLQGWLKNEINKRFRFLKKAPKWLQSPPQWPISENTPLIFIGQLDIGGISHDDGQIYIFFDERSKVFTNITQHT